MNYAIHRISLDVTDDSPSQLTISAKQGDNAKRLIITLLDDKKNYQIADGCYATFIARKSNGTWLNHPCIIENNKVVYDFMPTTVSTVGMVKCEIHIYKKILFRDDSGTLFEQNEDGTVTEVKETFFENITTADFTIAVHGTIMTGINDESEEDTGAILELIQRANTCINDMNIIKDEVSDKQAELGELAKDVQELIDKASYDPIRIKRFYAEQDTFELGTKLPKVTLYWELNKAPKNNPIINGVEVTPDVLPDGMCLYRVAMDYSESNLQEDKDYELVVTGDYGDVATAYVYVRFYNGIYYGVAPAPTGEETYDGDFIKGLGNKKLVEGKYSPFYVEAGVGQYIYYCLPSRLGVCSFSFDGFTGGFSKNPVATVSFNNGVNNYTEDYDIYKSDSACLGKMTISVS